jgi:hypothetical protein
MLIACSGCRRFRRRETQCPFCGARAASSEPETKPTGPRLSRAAILTTLALGGCSGPVNTPLYGAPAYGAIPYDSGKPDTGVEAGSDAAADAPADAPDGG